MADAIKYYFDEHVDPAIAHGLRRRGIDCLTTQEAGNKGLDDLDQLDFALTEQRVIMTYDKDYLVLHGAGTPHAGIVKTLADKYSIGQLIALLELLHQTYTADDMHNHLEYL
jgi:predicted nuclease of predicted toxin-antitoxin system